MNDYKRLNDLKGKEIDYDEIICQMVDNDLEVIVKRSENKGYNYISYYNNIESPQYLFITNNDIITDVIEVL